MNNGNVCAAGRLIGILVVCASAFLARAQQDQQAVAITGSSDVTVPARTSVDMLAEIKKSGKLRVGISEIVPWAMHDKKGDLVGFEVDVARKLARDLGVQLELHPDEFRYLIADLEANRFDIIISGFSIEAKRALQVDFSNPYDTTSVALGASVKAGGTRETMGAFNQPGVTIGVIEGMTSEDLVALSFPKAAIRTYTQDSVLFNDLLQGKITAAVADSPRLKILAQLYPDAITLPAVGTLGTFPSAFAVRRGDPEFVLYLNSWIAARSADRWLDTHRNYWFNTSDWASSL